MSPGGFGQVPVRRLGMEQGVDEDLLIVAAKSNEVYHLEGSDGRLVNALHDKICQRNAAQRGGPLEEILLVTSDSCLESLGHFGDRHRLLLAPAQHRCAASSRTPTIVWNDG